MGMVITPSLEDYLEAILLLEGGGEVRVTDVAAILEVSKASVNRAVSHLKESELVLQQRYSTLRLTEAGRQRAQEVMNRHRLLKRFLTDVLAVSAQTAEWDACRMEHVMSPETMQQLERFMDAYPWKSTPELATERLKLLPFTAALRALLGKDAEGFYKRTGWQANAGWPNPRFLEWVDSIAAEDADKGFGGWVFVRRSDGKIVGDGGFGGRPDASGQVLLTYSLPEGERGKGYALEALRALLHWCGAQAGVRAVVARCEAGNERALQLMGKLGLAETERYEDCVVLRKFVGA